MLSLRSIMVASSCLVACSTFSAADAPPTPDVPPGQVDGGAASDASDPNVGTPIGCDPMEEPQKSPACVVDAYGLFVDPTNGDDTKPGTKAAPVKTISAGLGKLNGRSRLYLCEGVLTDRLRLSPAASLYGGFACGTWSYTGARVRVVPLEVGAALTIDGAAQPAVLSDMEFVAAGGIESAPSSIAAIVSASANITFRRVVLTAQSGAPGASGLPGAAGALSASSPTPGTFNAAARLGQICTCSTGAVTAGGNGGKAGPNAANRVATNGAPTQLVVTPDGADGLAVGPVTNAHAGSDAPPGENGKGADHLLDLTLGSPTPVVSAAGVDGLNGLVGQGGGAAAAFPGGAGVPSTDGGGGGCGGCGGHKGTSGKGGGASIALLAVDSPMHLENCALSSGNGGHGGAGAGGGLGTPGGTGGAADLNSRSGGPGGQGAGGGAGGGGAGGITVGIAYRGAKPKFQGTITTGALGERGGGGILGTNDGIDGVKADTLLLP